MSFYLREDGTTGFGSHLAVLCIFHHTFRKMRHSCLRCWKDCELFYVPLLCLKVSSTGNKWSRRIRRWIIENLLRSADIKTVFFGLRSLPDHMVIVNIGRSCCCGYMYKTGVILVTHPFILYKAKS